MNDLNVRYKLYHESEAKSGDSLRRSEASTLKNGYGHIKCELEGLQKKVDAVLVGDLQDTHQREVVGGIRRRLTEEIEALEKLCWNKFKML